MMRRFWYIIAIAFFATCFTFNVMEHEYLKALLSAFFVVYFGTVLIVDIVDKKEIDVSVKEFTKEEIFDRVAVCVVECFNYLREEVTLDTDLEDELDYYRFNLTELVISIEKDFEIEISDADMLKMRTVENIVDYIYYLFN